MSAKGIRAGRAYVELLADDNKLTRGLKRASTRLKAFGAHVGGVGRKLAMLGGAALAPLIATAKVFSSFGDQVAKMSKRTGLSVETLSELRFVASQTGTEFASLETAFRKMQRGIYDAGRGLSTQTEALDDLGLKFKDLKNLSPEDQFKLLSDRLGKVTNDTKQAALAQMLFGRTGTNLIPMFEAGAEGISALQAEARRLGLTMSGEDAVAAEVFTDAVDSMSKVVKMATFHIGGALAPALQSAAQWITNAAIAATGWIQQHRGLIDVAFKVVAGVAAIGVGLMMVGKFAAIAAGGLKIVAAVMAVVTSPIALVVGAVVALTAALAYAAFGADGFSKMIDFVKGVVATAFDAIGFAVKNWRAIMEYSLVAAAYHLVKFGGQTKHFFTEAIPGYLKWFKGNWRDVFQTIWNGLKTFAKNVWTNLKNLWSAIVGLFKGEGWDFKWTGLMDGFESAVKELPKIAEREIGPLEKELAARMGNLGEELGKKWDAHRAADGPEKADAPAETVAPAIEAATVKMANLWDNLGDVAADTKTKTVGTFNASALAGMVASGGVAERTAKATEQTAKHTKKIANEAQRGPVFS